MSIDSPVYPEFSSWAVRVRLLTSQAPLRQQNEPDPARARPPARYLPTPCLLGFGREREEQKIKRAMASALARRVRGSPAAALWAAARGFASVGSDIVSAAPGVSLQKARSWDEGVATKFSTTPLKDIFHGKKVVIFGLPGAYTGVCSQSHVPSYKNNIDKLKAKGIDSVICVAVNDPYVLNGWAEKLQAKDAIEFYGDLDGSFHKSLDLEIDLSAALLGRRSHRWSAFVDDGKIKAFNVEKAPSDFKVSGAEVILEQI